MATEIESVIDTKIVAKMLRGLAIDVETNPAMAQRVVNALLDAHLLDDEDEHMLAEAMGTSSVDSLSPSASVPPTTLMNLQAARIDLLTLYRVGGDAQIRERLSMLDVVSLRRIIQIQGLDLDKKTTKLRSVTKLIDYIVDQTRNVVEQERELSRTASWML